MLRIGRIQYANCTPIFHALEQLNPAGVGYRYVQGVPAYLNRLLADGSIDICPSSSVEYALHPERYLIIPDISISSCGPVASVLLFSTQPIEQLDGATVLLSAESATSVNLLKILLKIRFGCTCRFAVTNLGLEQALDEASALLLIGDSALQAAIANPVLHIYDLGDLWCQWTGKPFVFALWFASRAAVARDGAAMSAFVGQLRQAKEYAMAHLEQIAAASPDAEWMEVKRLLYYWRHNLSYDLTEDHLDGLRRFYRYAAELGLIGAAPELAMLQEG